MAFPTVNFGAGTDGEFSHPSAHICINTIYNKNVRINSQTYTTAGSIIALQVKPRAGVTMTNDIIGIESMPGMRDTFTNSAGIVCYKAEPYFGQTDAAGVITGDVRCYEGSVGKPGTAGTVTGTISVLKCINNAYNTVTGGVYPIQVVTHGGGKAWSGFALLPDDGQVASSTENPASINGWVKVTIGTATRYIATYDNPTGG